MFLNAKKHLWKVLVLVLCILIAVQPFVSPVSVSALTDISYTEVDYSNQLQLDTPVTGSVSDENEIIENEYWCFYLDSGYTINLTAGESYCFTYEFSTDYEDGYLEPTIAILTGGEFNGDGYYYKGDCLAHIESWSYTKAKLELYFTPETTGNYRVLTGCLLMDDMKGHGVVTQLSVTKVAAGLKWKANLAKDDIGEDEDAYSYYTTSAPDGTIYTLVNFYSGYDMIKFTLFAYSPSGEELWSYDLPLPSNSQPLVGPDGTIYVSTICGFTSEEEIENEPSYIIALNPDGSEKWVRKFGGDDQEEVAYWFSGQMALSRNGILVSTVYNFYLEGYTLLAVDTNNAGEILWEKGGYEENLWFELHNTWSSPVIYNDIVYAPVYADWCGVMAFSLSDGEELWRMEVDDCCGPADCNISVDRDGTVYLVGDGYTEVNGELLKRPVYAIDSEGNVKWVKDIGMADYDSFQTAVDDNYLYVANYGYIEVLDKGTGELVREHQYLYRPCSLTVFDDGSVGILVEEGNINEVGYLSVYKITSDNTITRVFTISPTTNLDGIPQPAVTKDGYYVITVNETLYCYDLGATLANGWTIGGRNSAYINSVWKNTVRFIVDGETAEMEVFNGEMVEMPETPTRPSEAVSETVTRVYTFDKWYLDEECTIPFDPSMPITGDITLYAGWLYEDKAEQQPTEPVSSTNPTTTTIGETKGSGTTATNPSSPRTGAGVVRSVFGVTCQRGFVPENKNLLQIGGGSGLGIYILYNL